MQTLLAIECSSHVGAIAYLPDINRPDHWVGETVRDTVKLSAWVLPAIERVLAQAGAKKKDVGVVAFGAGPGAFTGVRTACAAAQALAYAWQVPLIAVDSLEALAAASGLTDVEIVLDARMDEVYCARFQRQASGQLIRLTETSVVGISEFPLRSTSALIGSGEGLVRNENRATSSPDATGVAEARWALGIAYIALTRLANQEFNDPLRVEPIYVRNEVAYTEAERASAASQARSVAQ